MIAQHKSQGTLAQPMPSSKDGVSRHHNFEMGSSTGELSYEGDAGAKDAMQKNLLANRKRDREMTASTYQSDLKGQRKPLSGLTGAYSKNARLEPII